MDRWLMIMLSHLLINGPLMIYIGYTKASTIYVFYLLFILGIFMLGYLGFKWFKNEMSAWLYVHLLVYIPLFMYTGYLGINNMEIPWYNYEFILAIGVAASGYHLLKIIDHYKK